MSVSSHTYEQQLQKAKERYSILKGELKEVKIKLKNDKRNTALINELRILNVKMSKIVYELEHSQSIIEIHKRAFGNEN